MLENQNLAYKTSWRDEYLKWIGGFANSNGGKLFIGVNDEGKVTGIENHRELLELLPNKIRDVLGLYVEINLRNEGEKYYLEIVVPRYDVPISLRGKYFIRKRSGPILFEYVRQNRKIW